jgi:hypothetical protein
MGEGFALIGTEYDRLLKASHFVGTIQKWQGLYTACIMDT